MILAVNFAHVYVLHNMIFSIIKQMHLQHLYVINVLICILSIRPSWMNAPVFLMLWPILKFMYTNLAYDSRNSNDNTKKFY